MNKNYTLLFLFSFFFNLFYFAQIPTHDWVKSVGGNGYEYGNAIKVDENGNSYTLGIFRSTTDFDPSSNTFILSPNGDTDIFLLKLDINGNFLWCVSFGGGAPSESYNDTGTDLVIDNSGNLYLTGYFKGTCDFNPGLGVFNLTSNGGSDIFILKLNSNGNFLWAKSIGGSFNDISTSIDLDKNNNIYLSGNFAGNTDFDPGNNTFFLNQVLPSSNGSFSITSQFFNLKLNSNGDFIWAKQGGDYSNDISFSKVDKNGNVFSTGRFGGICDFDPGSGVYNLSSNNGYYAAFISKLDANGNFLWAKAYNGSLNSEGTSIAVDTLGNVIVTGYYQGNMNFDLNGSYNIQSNAVDAFILKLDANGNFLWAKNIGNSSNLQEEGKSIVTDLNNNVYVIGLSQNTGNNLDLDPGSNSSYLNNDYGPFLVKLNSLGSFQWGIRPEAANWNNIHLCQTGTAGGVDGGYCIDVTNTGIFITGAFSQIVDFDPSNLQINLTSIGNNNSKDAFVHKLIQCITTTSTISVSSCNNYSTPSGNLISSSGIYYDTISNSFGCDSIITINLTINQNSFDTLNITKCGSFISPSGLIIFQSGIYNDTISNTFGCDSIITINLTINDFPNIIPSQNQTICFGESIILDCSGANNYSWDNNIINAVPFIPQVGNNTYTVIGTTLNGCSDTATVSITVNPKPTANFNLNISEGCAPLNVEFINNSLNYTNCQWNIENSTSINNCSISNIDLNIAGCYDITLIVVSNLGCSDSLTIKDAVCVPENPSANFSVSPNTFSTQNQQISFTNNSTNANSYIWDFGDNSQQSNEINPVHYYQSGISEEFTIMLIALNNNGCSDTAFASVYNIIDSISNDEFFIPNALSPNGDNENDDWTIIGANRFPNILIYVYNRWGQIVFNGDVNNYSWNGVYDNKPLPTADYYYVIELGNGIKYNGVVTLKRLLALSEIVVEHYWIR